MKKILMMLALICAVGQGAKAQANWDAVYAMTNTTSADWTQLNAGSTTGQTIGAAGTTTYYYADTNLTFSNSTVSGSGLTIQGTVYFYVPEGVTVTCRGANADGRTGAGAGIELSSGNTLVLLGKGTVNATGGNAANGGNGAAMLPTAAMAAKVLTPVALGMNRHLQAQVALAAMAVAEPVPA